MLGVHLIAKTKFGPAYFVRFQFLERSKILKDADVSFFRFFPHSLPTEFVRQLCFSSSDITWRQVLQTSE